VDGGPVDRWTGETGGRWTVVGETGGRWDRWTVHRHRCIPSQS
jgi:hypothetical protein